MNHQNFIRDNHTTLKKYFDKIDEKYNFETVSFEQRLKCKDEDIERLNAIILEKDKEIKRLTINEKKLTEDYEDFTKVSLLKTAHKKYDKVVKKNSVLLLINEKYKKEVENLKTKVYNKVGNIDKNITIKVEEIKDNHAPKLIEEQTEDTDEEVELELLKIKRKYYYATPTNNDVRELYAALKIRKNEYDVGEYVGEYSSGIIRLEAQ